MKIWQTGLGGIQGALLIWGLSGCSGPGQDVRVSFCKDMVAAHLNALDSIWWTGQDSRIKRPEFARVDLRFQIGDSGGDDRLAACFYEYDTPDENAMTHADPLAAYATTPYRMMVDGRDVPEAEINRLITDVGLLQADEFLKRFWRWWEELFG